MNDEKGYLEHFWDHSVGNEVCGMTSGVIEELHGELGEQVKLKNDDNIHYIQDLNWVPNKEDFKDIFRKFGATVTKDSIIYNRVIYPIPETIEESASTIREIRLLAYNQGKEVFKNFFSDGHLRWELHCWSQSVS